MRHFFLLALFFVAFSTALTNLFVGMTYISFALALWLRPALRRVLWSPPGVLAFLLLVLFIAGATWSIAPRADILLALRKYAKLLLLPIGIGLSWRDGTVPARALRWFMAGAAVLAISSYLVWLGWMPTSSLGWWRAGDSRDAFVFRNHITIGILLGFAATASFLSASYRTTARASLPAIAAGIFFSVPIIFLGQGRTGYVALFVGLVTLFLLRTRITPLRTLSGVGAIAVLFLGFYAISPNFQSRTNALITEVRTNEVRSPNGLRLSFMQVGIQVVAAHPLIGLGTGSFAEAYAPTAQRNWPSGSEMATARHQPHSEFLLVAVQLGFLGSIIYFAILWTMGRAALAMRSFEADALALLLSIYVVSSTFNSLLWDPTEGYWFLLLSGCLYVSSKRQREGTL
jgi:O-antigen ligase